MKLDGWADEGGTTLELTIRDELEAMLEELLDRVLKLLEGMLEELLELHAVSFPREPHELWPLPGKAATAPRNDRKAAAERILLIE